MFISSLFSDTGHLLNAQCECQRDPEDYSVISVETLQCFCVDNSVSMRRLNCRFPPPQTFYLYCYLLRISLSGTFTTADCCLSGLVEAVKVFGVRSQEASLSVIV